MSSTCLWLIGNAQAVEPAATLHVRTDCLKNFPAADELLPVWRQILPETSDVLQRFIGASPDRVEAVTVVWRDFGDSPLVVVHQQLPLESNTVNDTVNDTVKRQLGEKGWQQEGAFWKCATSPMLLSIQAESSKLTLGSRSLLQWSEANRHLADLCERVSRTSAPIQLEVAWTEIPDHVFQKHPALFSFAQAKRLTARLDPGAEKTTWQCTLDCDDQRAAKDATQALQWTIAVARGHFLAADRQAKELLPELPIKEAIQSLARLAKVRQYSVALASIRVEHQAKALHASGELPSSPLIWLLTATEALEWEPVSASGSKNRERSR